MPQIATGEDKGVEIRAPARLTVALVLNEWMQFCMTSSRRRQMLLPAVSSLAAGDGNSVLDAG